MRSMAANGIELISTKLSRPPSGNGDSGIRLSSSRTRVVRGTKPWRLIPAVAGEGLLPLLKVGPKLPAVMGKRCSTSAMV